MFAQVESVDSSAIERLGATYVDSTSDFIQIGSVTLLIFMVLGLFVSFLKGVR